MARKHALKKLIEDRVAATDDLTTAMWAGSRQVIHEAKLRASVAQKKLDDFIDTMELR